MVSETKEWRTTEIENYREPGQDLNSQPAMSPCERMDTQ